MSKLEGFVDDSRAVLVMEGAQAREVLQGVVTNDVDLVTPGHAVYAALLTPQGKYLFDFFLLDGGTDRVLIDVAAERAPALAQRLGMYCLRRNAKITGAAPLQVGLAWGEGTSPDWIRDPRSDALGWRVYAEDTRHALDEAGVEPATREAYDSLRVAALVPETGHELLSDETYILEAGFEHLSGVDFRKGCYVGQEVTARMKHKTELRKGLVRVSVAGTAEPGTAITSNGKPAGTLFTVSDGQGLAHLRLDRAGPDMQAGSARVSYEP